jgi:hypothetical protein
VKTAVVAVASFLLGISITVVVGRHLVPKSVFAQGVIAGGVPLVPPIDAAVPKVEPLHRILIDNSVFLGVPGAEARYVLDGLVMSNVRFDNPLGEITLAYGGGAYSLTNILISGRLSLELTGAAANTAHFLDSLGLLRTPPTPMAGGKLGILTTVPTVPAKTTEPPKNKPIIKNIKLGKPLKGDIASQYDGTKR